MADLRQYDMQKTIQKEISIAGTGIFTGQETSIRIRPAPPGAGIIFQRTDLENALLIPAKLEFVCPASRCTRLASGNASIMLVEHLLSALYGMQIDNALIEVRGPEIPGMDGSSRAFVDLISEAGVEAQKQPRDYLTLDQPVFWSEGKIQIIALPSLEYRLSYVLHYPQSNLIGSQYYSLSLTPDSYREEIAPCRTFSLYEEIRPFVEMGLIKGGGLENALVIRDDKVLNPEGARFPDEMVRHKILDLIGDLSLVGVPILAHIIAICSGHVSNASFAKVLSQTLQTRSANV